MIRQGHRTDLRDLLDQAAFRNDKTWLMASEQAALWFLERNESADWTVVYADFKHVYLHSVLAPKVRLQGYDHSRERSEPFPQPDDCWRVNYSYNLARKDDVRIAIEQPMDDSPTLRGGEKLVFQRNWPGDPTATVRTEVNQKLVHCLEVYWVEERDAFCRLDERGDIEDVIRIVHDRVDGSWDQHGRSHTAEGAARVRRPGEPGHSHPLRLQSLLERSRLGRSREIREDRRPAAVLSGWGARGAWKAM